MPTQILISSGQCQFAFWNFGIPNSSPSQQTRKTSFSFTIFSDLHFSCSAISRKNYKNKARTPAGPRSDKKCWCAFAEFLQNIYRNNLLQKYRNLSFFNYFHISQKFQKVFALSHEEEHQSTQSKNKQTSY